MCSWLLNIKAMKILLLFVFFSMFSGAKAPLVTLQVEITNVKHDSGKLFLALFKPDEKFGEGRPKIFKVVEVKSDDNQSTEFQVEPGRYALAIFHDLNGNDILDKNFMGIPKEPYGFSKNFRPRFSAPSFEDCAFDLPSTGTDISVKMTN